MSKKKTKKKNAGPPKPKIQLSQCMIVKNEEKNIEKALSWAKGIAFEQIVVDTGSTDRTVEIAKKMGAKVYHFEWIDDFSAAKNYAIEQATGNWIAFLDADEYFTREDAKILLDMLKKIRADEDLRDNCLVLNFPLVNINDEGKPMSVFDQERVFRNVPAARFVGRIHERLTLPPESLRRTDEIKIFHTGYATSVFEQTDKLERNIEMLRKELVQRPDDINLKAYLADALRVVGEKNEEKLAEAHALYYEVINAEAGAYYHHRLNAYRILIDKCSKDRDSLEEAEQLSIRGLAEFPGDMDIEYFYGAALNGRKDFASALRFLLSCESKLNNAISIDQSAMLSAKPVLLYHQLAVAAQGLGDVNDFIKYATMALTADKTEAGILGPLILTLVEHNTPDEDVLGLLSKLYNLNDPRDMLFIARAAKNSGAFDFARMIAETISGKG